MRVLSWNLYHGRDFPPDKALFTLRSRLLRVTERNETHVQVNRSLFLELASWLAGHEWDAALLQEAPPLWFRGFKRRTGASGARAFTSRNVVPPLQRLLAWANPDLIASWEGGSNQLLVREPGRVVEQRQMTLTLRPERRTMLWGRVELPGGERVCLANLHASAGLPRKATAEVLAAASAAIQWSEGEPLIFGGDLNLRPARDPFPFVELRERFGLGEPAGPNAIDHLLTRGLEVVEPPHRLSAEERELPQSDGRCLRLSDHAPVLGEWELGPLQAVR
jgi:endonuclease/exonuclease/phosphatase family metal-dependent hydrolase